MKKITFLLVGAALALAACSKTETVNVSGRDRVNVTLNPDGTTSREIIGSVILKNTVPFLAPSMVAAS